MKRRKHITKAATASQILRTLRVSKADVRAALRAVSKITQDAE